MKVIGRYDKHSVAIVPTLVGEVNNTSSSGEGGVDIGDGGDGASNEPLVLHYCIK